MVRISVSINWQLLERLRDLPDRAQRKVRARIQTELKGELQADTDRVMETPPGPVSSPFDFATERSRRYWFVLVHENPDMTDGQHYIRSGDMGSSFEVRVSDRLRESLISITNRKTAAVYVYGQRMVPGHENTGYREQVQRLRQEIRSKARIRINGYWRAAIKEEV